MTKLTPSLAEYISFRDKFSDFIILYQIGDFYEVFFEDAKKVSTILNIALTSRDKTSNNPIPMCGVPVSSVDNYITKLLEAGLSVVIISQKNSGKGQIIRFVDKILTPGIRIDLVEDQNDGVLAALVHHSDNVFEFAHLTLINKEIHTYSTNSFYDILAILSIHKIKEILVANLSSELIELMQNNHRNLVIRKTSGNCPIKILKQYIASLGFSINDWKIIERSQEPFIDNLSLNNLNITSSDDSVTLIDCIKTATNQGQQKLRELFLNPFTDSEQIKKSQKEIEFILKNLDEFTKIQQKLKKTNNLDRIGTRIELRKITIKDLKNLKQAIQSILEILDYARDFKEEVQSLNEISYFEDQARNIFKILEPINLDSSNTLEDPELYLRGYFTELDELINLKNQLDSLLITIEEEERKRSGIPNLKVKLTQNFGIVIEITNSYKKLVPSDYIRKQTLVNCERYTIPKLIELESKLNGIDDQIFTLNRKIFERINEKLLEFSKVLNWLGRLTAFLDVRIALAIFSQDYELVQPSIIPEPVIRIKDGFHPILKKVLGLKCQTNNFNLDQETRHFILTGPNMGGKSTFLRQIGLTVFLNQIGCFVPAKSAELGIFTKIRTRIGSNDQIFKGVSTFMAECLDVANILKNCSPTSLVLIDELGRGTNADEGLAFCVAVLNQIYSTNTPCLLATHFHQIKEFFPNFSFIQTEVLETTSGPIFTHVIKPGILSTSYALFVAKIAGIQDSIIKQAESILCRLKKTSTINGANQSFTNSFETERSFNKELTVCEIIKNLDPNSLTPLESLNILSALREKLLKE